jgi:hypothetical protein
LAAIPPPGRVPARLARWSLALLVVSALTALAGCSHDVDARLPVHASDPACATAAAKLPKTLLKADRRSTHPSSPALAAWGDPAIILRCGVEAPGPTPDHCETVDGIDWVVQDLSDGKDFTTYGRSPAVQVLVPKHYAPEEFALTALTSAVATIPQSEHRCS